MPLPRESSRFTVARTDDGSGASADCLKRVNPKDFPFVVWGPMPPFALGSVWAVCPNEQTAEVVRDALELVPEHLIEDAIHKTKSRMADTFRERAGR